MHLAEAVDIASKLLALASVILHTLGYIDTGTLAAALSTLAAVMAPPHIQAQSQECFEEPPQTQTLPR